MSMNARNVAILTVAGKKALEVELQQLKEEKIPAVVERLGKAREEGDLSENSAYHGAKEQLEFLQNRVSELEDILDNSTVVKSSGKSSSVDLGSIVSVIINGKKMIFSIVGDWEANPVAGKISGSSPIGKALMGKKVGDKVEIVIPAGKVIYTITSIE